MDEQNTLDKALVRMDEAVEGVDRFIFAALTEGAKLHSIRSDGLGSRSVTVYVYTDGAWVLESTESS